MYIANKDLTHDEVIAVGADPPWREDYTGSQMDCIVEVDMAGNVVWEWWFFDHLVQDLDPTKDNYVEDGKTIADYPGKLDINWGMPVSRDWLHCNSMDYNEELDRVVINSVQGEFYVIDHGATFIAGNPEASIALAASSVGDFLYRFGDPARYDQGDPPYFPPNWLEPSTGHKQMGGTHDIQWIRAAHYTGGPVLPGAGNFLIFDNGGYLYQSTNQSKILEINPYLDAEGNDTGNYVNPPDAGYHWSAEGWDRYTHQYPRNTSNQIIWTYASKSNQGFFSHYISGCQRLPNGNTMIDAGAWGHFFEVTPEGEIVWEYINPVTLGSIVTILPDAFGNYNSVFRAYRYGPDYPGLAGKDLTPKGTITGRIPGTVDVYPEAVPITGWGIPPGTTSESGAGAGGGAGGGGGSGY